MILRGLFYNGLSYHPAMHEAPENRFYHKDSSFIENRAREISRAMKENRITADDALLIGEFVAGASRTNRLAPAGSYKMVNTLIGLRRFIGPYRDNTVADINEGMERIRNFGLKQTTMADYMKMLKRFCIWLAENGYGRSDEKALRKITIERPKAAAMDAESFISEDEVGKMLAACRRSNDRALIMMLYEGAFRIGELGKLKWGQVKLNEHNVIVHVADTYGRYRLIPLYKSMDLIHAWSRDYPGGFTPDDYVFITRSGMQLQYMGVSHRINRIGERAGIGKHLTPQMFRQSAIANMIRDGVPETIIKKMCWGTDGTEMFKKYAHLVHNDVEQAMAVRNKANIK